jgi:branched-chain amino acid transport system substrate-binding protein
MFTRRRFTTAGLAVAATATLPLRGARAAAKPLRIGFTIAQSGGLAAGGKAGLLAIEIWRDNVNAKGGVMGRPVELISYDDQSNAANVPALYSKLLDIDGVDILMSPYGTNVAGPTVPIAKERGRVLFGMFAIGLNMKSNYDRYFSMGPWGPDPLRTYSAYFELAKKNGLKKLAIIAADAEFQQNAAEGGRQMSKGIGAEIVFDQRYPANTTDFSGLLQSLQAVEPDMIFVCSYPTESAAIVRGIDEIGLPASVQLFGGGMVGIQNASLLEALGNRLDGITNYDTFSVDPKLMAPGAQAFLDEYAAKAVAAKIDTLGHFLPPYWYATGQVIKAAVEATGGTDDKALAEWLHANEIPTVVGPVRFGANGEWAENRVLMVQYRDVAAHDVDQFRKPGKAVVVAPEKYVSGDFIKPFAKARG